VLASCCFLIPLQQKWQLAPFVLACPVESKGTSMDEFSLIVLEDTLELATEALPSDLISDCVGNIRECVGAMSADPSDTFSTHKLRIALNRLSDIAYQNNKFLVQARLQSIASQFVA
jgi:hypothetical protein